MVSYDPKLLYEFADRLYRQANQIIATSTVVGALIGAAAGFFANREFDIYVLIGAVIGGAIGYSAGTARGRSL